MSRPEGTFCPLPWNSINIRNNGDIRICCNANSYTANRGIVRKEDGTPYNAGRDDWDEVRNADLMKEVRVSMMNGEWHPECERCRQEETNGIRSRREYEAPDWSTYFGNFIDLEKAKQITAEDGTLDTSQLDINFVDIRYGNFCNLKCRMCGPTDSHQWYDDFVELYGSTKYKDTHDVIQLQKNDKGRWVTDQYDWFQTEQQNLYWHNFEKYATKAHKLYIVGGEPLIIPEHTESLERIVASGNAGNMRLEYNTNLTMVPDKLIRLWENFKEVRLGVSIDGTGEVFNYQRAPANFDSVYDNMLRIENANINLKGWLAFTVTVFNVWHFPEFMKWKLTESKWTKYNPVTDSRPVVSHHMCHSPKYYNVKVLPPELKQKLADHYEDYIAWAETADIPDNARQSFIKICRGVIKFALSEDYHEEFLDKFLEHTVKLDEIRNQSILDIAPEYTELFDAYNKREQ